MTERNDEEVITIQCTLDGEEIQLSRAAASRAEFLRDNLHNIIANQASFPSNPEKALMQGFKEAEETFMKQNL